MKRFPPSKILALLLAPLSPSLLSAQPHQRSVESEKPNDIIVIAKALQTVRIHYLATGRHLKRCDIRVSSGRENIDATMCHFVKSCLSSGATSRPDAMSCVNHKIAQMSDPDTAVDDVFADQERDFEQEEIIVTAAKLPAIGGRWAFFQTGTYKSVILNGPTAALQWEMCIKDDDALRAISFIIAYRPVAPSASIPAAPDDCRRWTMDIKKSVVSGAMQCLVGKARMTGTLTGTISDTNIRISRAYKALGPNIRSEGSSDIIGTKVGECR